MVLLYKPQIYNVNETKEMKMTTYEVSILNARIRSYSLQRDKCSERLDSLKDYSGIVLKRVPHRDKVIYYYKPEGSKKYKYIGDDSNEKVQLIKEARFLTALIERLDDNIAALKASTDNIKPLDKVSVFQSMPLTYRGAVITDPEREERIRKWKAEQAAIKAKYPVKNPEQITVPHPDGSKMRSKSEVIISLILADHNIPYAYEVPMVVDGVLLYPDFRLLSPLDLSTLYILEHFGRLDLPRYQNSVGFKIAQYMKEGYIPNVNFFMTFDVVGGSLNLEPLYDMILKIT